MYTPFNQRYVHPSLLDEQLLALTYDLCCAVKGWTALSAGADIVQLERADSRAEHNQHCIDNIMLVSTNPSLICLQLSLLLTSHGQEETWQ